MKLYQKETNSNFINLLLKQESTNFILLMK